MSVKVNLLPAEVGQRSKAGRQRALSGAAFGLLLLGIGGVWYLNGQRVDDARTELAAAEQEVATLEGELAELAPYADLQDRHAESDSLLVTTLGDEVSVAGVLQDLSAVLPPNVELDTLAVSVTGENTPSPGGERLVLGSVSTSGRLLLGFAPGASRLLIDVDRASSFENPLLSASYDASNDSHTFTLDMELGPEALSGRYDDPSDAETPSGADTEVAP